MNRQHFRLNPVPVSGRLISKILILNQIAGLPRTRPGGTFISDHHNIVRHRRIDLGWCYSTILANCVHFGGRRCAEFNRKYIADTDTFHEIV